jgi:hypothetical protein
MPYGIRATLATSHESARRGFKYWIKEIGVEPNLGSGEFTGLSTSRKMISFWCAMSCFRAFEIGLFFPDAHQRLMFTEKLAAKLCLEELERIIQETAQWIPVPPLISIRTDIRGDDKFA